MNDYIDDFLKYISYKQSGSKNTYIAYQYDLNKFMEYFADDDLNELSQNDIMDYLELLKKGHVNGHKLSNTSFMRKVAVIRSFYQYLNKYTDIKNNPIKNIKVKTQERKIPDFLTFEQIEDLLATFDDSEVGIRNRLMIELMYASGLRVSELVNLSLQDLDLEQCLLKVEGKGKKQRIVPFYPSLKPLIIKYLEIYYQKYKQDDKYLFMSLRHKNITVRSVQMILDKASKDANIPLKVHPHMLRHSFATHLLDNGASLRSVQYLLGHENLVTTQIYTHVTVDKLKEIINNKHPLSK